MSLVPSVILGTANGERSFDIYSRLLQDRIIIFQEEVNDFSAGNVVAQMLHLEAENPDAPIWLYINSPGGSISAGMAIYDTMNMISCPVYTVCMGMAASMGAFLLGAGEKGHRYSLPNSTIMIHQPLGGAKGQATEIEIVAKRILRLREDLNRKIADYTGQDYETVCKDTERDNYMTAQEAKDYGIVDVVLDKETRKSMIQGN